MFSSFIIYSILVTASVFIILHIEEHRTVTFFILISIFIEFITSLCFFIYVTYKKSIICCNSGSYILLGNNVNNTFTIGYSIITFYHHFILFMSLTVLLFILLVFFKYDFSDKYITFFILFVFQILFLLSFLINVVFI